MLFISITITSCKNEGTEEKKNNAGSDKPQTGRISPPSFNSDSAYFFVQKQVDFGPRIPGTSAHTACAQYLTGKLKSYGFETLIQKGTVETFDGKKFSLKNIVASFKPELQNRILICSHWDTRPWADEDTEAFANKPFDGANDGGSGVGVALEVARQIQVAPPKIGVDIVFFDLEDYGDADGNEKSWCLGSQYWSTNLHKQNYYANFGILLDMVGHTNAIFPKEEQSVSFASAAVNKIWKAADNIGYRSYFSMETRAHVGVDDH
ncbi:MAG TPA: M28 family peptidase, partial [Bacteroidia bacterium]|nr:M28 family peptidase [Bacteroidia bacterium]